MSIATGPAVHVASVSVTTAVVENTVGGMSLSSNGLVGKRMPNFWLLARTEPLRIGQEYAAVRGDLSIRRGRVTNAVREVPLDHSPVPAWSTSGASGQVTGTR